MPELSVVIVSFNTRTLLADCLDTLIRSTDDVDVEIIVVDNGSADGSPGMLRERYPSVHLIACEQNLGFAGANNMGIEAVHGPVVLLLNSDAFVNPEVITSCLRVMTEEPDVGMVGVKLLNSDRSIQAENGSFPSLWTDFATSLGFDQLRRKRGNTATDVVKDTDWVHGACMFARREAIDDVGLLDESFFMYSEEVDWCHRFWQHGWRVVYRGDVSVVHLGGSSSRDDDLGRRISLYRSRLGLRRRLGGARSSAALWGLLIVGFSLRVPIQMLIRSLPRKSFHRHGPLEDLQLLRQILAMDPLAAWAKAD